MDHEEEVGDDNLNLDDEVVMEGGGSITVRALCERVAMVEPGIVVMREIDRPSPATLMCLFSEVERLAADCEKFGVVVDLPKAAGSVHTAEYRRFIPKRFSELHASHPHRLKLVAVASTASLASRVATKFLIGRMTNVPLTLEKSRERAIEAVRKALIRD